MSASATVTSVKPQEAEASHEELQKTEIINRGRQEPEGQASADDQLLSADDQLSTVKEQPSHSEELDDTLVEDFADVVLFSQQERSLLDRQAKIKYYYFLFQDLQVTIFYWTFCMVDLEC